jgi:hypothetical protein
VIRTLVGSIGLVLAVPLTTAIGVAVVRASDRGASLGASRRSNDVEEFEDLEPAPAADRSPGDEQVGADGSEPDSNGTDAAGTPAPVPQTPVAAAATTRGQDDAPAVSTTRGTGRSEADTEAKWRRWRRQKPVDDFGFSDLRDPDEKGTGPGGRPGR